MYNPRYLELLAAANLAPSELQRAQLQGQLQAQNAQAWSSGITGSLQALIGGADKLHSAAEQDQAQQAATLAKQAVAENAGAVGENALLPGAEYGADPNARDPTSYAQTPGQVAKSAVGGVDELQDKPAGGALEGLGNWFSGKADALARARADAEAGIAQNVTQNRQAQYEKDRQAQLDALNTQKTNAEIGLTTANTGLAGANTTRVGAETGDIQEQQHQRALANQAAERAQAIDNAIAPAVAGRAKIDDIIANHPELDTGEVVGRFNLAKQRADVAAADLGLKKSEATRNYGEANKLTAEARTVAGGKPLEEGARKDIATLQSQLDQIAALKAQKGSVDTGTLSAFQNSLAQFMGIDDPTKTQFRANTAQIRDELLHALSGAAVSPSEMKRLMEGLPSFSDNDSAYSAKLEATQGKLTDLLKNRVGVERASGANVSGIALPSPLPASSPPPSPAAQAAAAQLLAQGRSADEVRAILKTRGLY